MVKVDMDMDMTVEAEGDIDDDDHDNILRHERGDIHNVEKVLQKAIQDFLAQGEIRDSDHLQEKLASVRLVCVTQSCYRSYDCECLLQADINVKYWHALKKSLLGHRFNNQ